MSAKAAPGPSYVLDKLQSLSGLIPIGAFLVEHLFENSYALVSEQKYNYISGKLQTIPWRVPIELLFIWLPILFHGGYGIYIWWKGKSNALAHPWMANWLYTLQRWSGIVAFVYIGWHVYTERFLTQGKSTYAGVAQSMHNPYYAAFYVIGVVASAFHLGNGIWNFSCKWGITVTPRAQRAAGYVGAAVAIALMVLGVATVAGFWFNWRPFEFYTQ
jgi:succinate dehydrogenase / fumarate reductase, cytochrome b subunit